MPEGAARDEFLGAGPSGVGGWVLDGGPQLRCRGLTEEGSIHASMTVWPLHGAT